MDRFHPAVGLMESYIVAGCCPICWIGRLLKLTKDDTEVSRNAIVLMTINMTQWAKRVQEKLGARHEAVNKYVRKFAVTHSFRHDKSKHEFCVRACVVLTQLGLHNGEDIFHVDY